MAFIAVANFQLSSGGASIYLTGSVTSSGGTNAVAEVYLDDTATVAEMRDAIADAARAVCRQNSEDIAVDATVTIFGNIVQVS